MKTTLKDNIPAIVICALALACLMIGSFAIGEIEQTLSPRTTQK